MNSFNRSDTRFNKPLKGQPYRVSQDPYYKAEGFQVNTGLDEKFKDQNYLMILEEVTDTIIKQPLKALIQQLTKTVDEINHLVEKKIAAERDRKFFNVVHKQFIEFDTFMDKLHQYIAPCGVELPLQETPETFDMDFKIESTTERVKKILSKFDELGMFKWSGGKIASSEWLKNAYYINDPNYVEFQINMQFVIFANDMVDPNIKKTYHRYIFLLRDVFKEFYQSSYSTRTQEHLVNNRATYPKFNDLWASIDEMILFYKTQLSKIKTDVRDIEKPFHEVPLSFLKFVKQYIDQQLSEEKRKAQADEYLKKASDYKTVMTTGYLPKQKVDVAFQAQHATTKYDEMYKDMMDKLLKPIGNADITKSEGISYQEKLVLKAGCRIEIEKIHNDFVKKAISFPLTQEQSMIVVEFFKKMPKGNIYGATYEQFKEYYPKIFSNDRVTQLSTISTKPISRSVPSTTMSASAVNRTPTLSKGGERILQGLLSESTFTNIDLLYHAKLAQIMWVIDKNHEKKMIDFSEKEGEKLPVVSTFELHQLVPILFSKLQKNAQQYKIATPKEYIEILVETKLLKTILTTTKNYMVDAVDRYMVERNIYSKVSSEKQEHFSMKDLLEQIHLAEQKRDSIQRKIRNAEKVPGAVKEVKALIEKKVQDFGTVRHGALQQGLSGAIVKRYSVNEAYILGVYELLESCFADEDTSEKFYDKKKIEIFANIVVGVENDLRAMMAKLSPYLHQYNEEERRMFIRENIQSQETRDRMISDWKILHDLSLLQDRVEMIKKQRNLILVDPKEFYEQVGLSFISTPAQRYLTNAFHLYVQKRHVQENTRISARNGKKSQEEPMKRVTDLQPEDFKSLIDDVMHTFPYRAIIEPLAFDLKDLETMPKVSRSILTQKDKYFSEEQIQGGDPTVIMNATQIGVTHLLQPGASSQVKEEKEPVREVVNWGLQAKDLGKTISVNTVLNKGFADFAKQIKDFNDAVTPEQKRDAIGKLSPETLEILRASGKI